jgi:hypothetical protein
MALCGAGHINLIHSLRETVLNRLYHFYLLLTCPSLLPILVLSASVKIFLMCPFVPPHFNCLAGFTQGPTYCTLTTTSIALIFQLPILCSSVYIYIFTFFTWLAFLGYPEDGSRKL